jgi:hypothetical protein
VNARLKMLKRIASFVSWIRSVRSVFIGTNLAHVLMQTLPITLYVWLPPVCGSSSLYDTVWYFLFLMATAHVLCNKDYIYRVTISFYRSVFVSRSCGYGRFAVAYRFCVYNLINLLFYRAYPTRRRKWNTPLCESSPWIDSTRVLRYEQDKPL